MGWVSLATIARSVGDAKPATFAERRWVLLQPITIPASPSHTYDHAHPYGNLRCSVQPLVGHQRRISKFKKRRDSVKPIPAMATEAAIPARLTIMLLPATFRNEYKYLF